MMRSLYSGVSGLRNHQTRMDVIGNNIANVNTVGFKASRVQFQDVLSQTITGASAAQGDRGGTNPMQVGLGMGLASIDTIFSDGSFQPTGKGTDLSIAGQGFFILADGLNSIYTRAGNFDFDTDGNYLVPGTGLKVMGWMANNTGAINTAGDPTTITIPVGATMPARASTDLVIANNLNSEDLAGTTATTSRNVYDSLGADHKVNQTFTKIGNNTWISQATVPDAAGPVTGATQVIRFNADGTLQSIHDATLNPLTVPTAALTFQAMELDPTAGWSGTRSISLIEPGGGYRAFNVTYTRTGATSWDYTMSDPTGAAITAGATGTVNYAAGDYTFAPTGFTYTATDGTFPPVVFGVAGDVASTGAGPTANGFAQESIPLTDNGPAVNLQFTAIGGGLPMSIELDMAALTQFGNDTTIQATSTDGYTAGTLDTTSIDTNGIVVGKFTNGKSQNMARVALATFNNAAGLTKVGENMYAESNNSGAAQVGESGTGGRGNFNPGTLEMANVDLANEFSNMIITQRGFQANSKIITVTDEMLEQLANLKR